MIKVLFVCLGNICRSPLGEGIFRHLVMQRGLEAHFLIDSAGTGNWHIGAPPHADSQRVARNRGVDIADQRARQLTPLDLREFDYLIAMDTSNRVGIQALDPNGRYAEKVKLMLEYHPSLGFKDVPDPYFGGPEGFDTVYEMLEQACGNLLDEILNERGLPAQER
jgi:protein-tyrosine phosphatase